MRYPLGGLLILLFASNAAAQSSATIGGVMVHHGSRLPVDGARVAVVGTGLAVMTGADGRFELAGIPVGARVLQARAVGFVVGSWLLQLRDGQSFRDTFELEPVNVTVEAVYVRAEATDWRSEAGFERRRANGVGAFITREDIRRRHPATISDLMRSVSGVVTTCRGNGGCMIQMARSTRGCQPEYFLDGYPATLATGANFPIDIVAIRGVEVYRNEFETPVEFQKLNLRCGVIAIWTIDPGERFDTPPRP